MHRYRPLLHKQPLARRPASPGKRPEFMEPLTPPTVLPKLSGRPARPAVEAEGIPLEIIRIYSAFFNKPNKDKKWYQSQARELNDALSTKKSEIKLPFNTMDDMLEFARENATKLKKFKLTDGKGKVVAYCVGGTLYHGNGEPMKPTDKFDSRKAVEASTFKYPATAASTLTRPAPLSSGGSAIPLAPPSSSASAAGGLSASTSAPSAGVHAPARPATHSSEATPQQRFREANKLFDKHHGSYNLLVASRLLTEEEHDALTTHYNVESAALRTKIQGILNGRDDLTDCTAAECLEMEKLCLETTRELDSLLVTTAKAVIDRTKPAEETEEARIGVDMQLSPVKHALVTAETALATAQSALAENARLSSSLAASPAEDDDEEDDDDDERSGLGLGSR